MITDAKDSITKIVANQPDDSSFDEIIQEIMFARMIDRGVADADAGNMITHEELLKEVQTWYK